MLRMSVNEINAFPWFICKCLTICTNCFPMMVFVLWPVIASLTTVCKMYFSVLCLKSLISAFVRVCVCVMVGNIGVGKCLYVRLTNILLMPCPKYPDF